jgi:NAD(P)-dependent dehydrogenase (short-subunit alcohol dehydrogenase family)
MNQLMDDKVVVLTGASSGIGQATMALLCAEGAKVVGSARDQSRLDEAIKTVNDGGGTAIGITADMSDDEQVGRLVDAAVAEFGRIDVLINSAGVGYSYRTQRPDSMNAIDETPLEEWDHVMGINLGSVVHASRRVIPVMQKNGGGAIVNVASVLGMVGHPDAHAYTTAKGAIINLTRSMATTYGKDGIRSNVICPGYIDTPMVAEYVDYLNSDDHRYTWNPMGRTGRSEEIAKAMLFMASGMSSYCNGSVLVVDGGMIASS